MEDLFKTLGEIVKPTEQESPKVPNDFYDDDEDYDDDYYDDDYYQERREEELQERASNCTCGAWRMSKTGEVFHVADCCCGAE
jgi:hypothetical protein